MYGPVIVLESQALFLLYLPEQRIALAQHAFTHLAQHRRPIRERQPQILLRDLPVHKMPAERAVAV